MISTQQLEGTSQGDALDKREGVHRLCWPRPDRIYARSHHVHDTPGVGVHILPVGEGRQHDQRLRGAHLQAAGPTSGHWQSHA